MTGIKPYLLKQKQLFYSNDLVKEEGPSSLAGDEKITEATTYTCIRLNHKLVRSLLIKA
jgi:hypothetical protein